jgi:hypothetical protein
MRVLVCGSRDWTDSDMIWAELDELHSTHLEYGVLAGDEEFVVIHGAARGADNIAALWASTRDVDVLAFPADWATYGKSAGPRRNHHMLIAGRPELVLAFKDNFGARTNGGTEHMVRIARDAGILVSILSHTAPPLLR